MSKVRLAALAGAVLMFGCSASSSSSASTTPLPPQVQQCPYGQDPCAGWQAPQPPAGQPDQVVNLLVLYDKDHIPAIVMKSAGGLEVENDNITVRGPGTATYIGDVMVQLRPDATIYLGGQVITPGLVQFMRCLRNNHTLAYCRSQP